MRIFLGFIYIFSLLLFFLSCSSIFLYESEKGNSLNVLALKALMVYPDLKISISDIEKYSNFNDSHKCDFDFLKRGHENMVYISESSYNNNIEYIKKLYLYNKILYRVILAYSLVQGLPFKSEILRYLNNNNIKEKFPLRIKFPFSVTYIENKYWVVLEKNFLDLLIQDKSDLMIAKQKMEIILKYFAK
ncbi:hypothetical protein [Borrelia miyamotoi]|nr:hypothetical protein [Borrelia miyamotoi]QBK62463.1 hypothetical protein EZU67_04650 [Borrelia miyamotoi]QBK63707.1 hypothetical protein EZU68_04655 [Borrelia miyamotoi]QBK64999.1 hypothetical protein EZU69_04650 [Borrelia miyamotoi]QBK66255.1 hypothetical protein EZU70_04645 [Borrelia miyamotoi]QBL99180.1 hypothetical protein EZU71_04695 [Borrelia miyamotoi]